MRPASRLLPLRNSAPCWTCSCAALLSSLTSVCLCVPLRWGLWRLCAVLTRACARRAVMSSNGEENVVFQGVTHGAVDFLIKPVRQEELRNVWQHVVRRKLQARGSHTAPTVWQGWTVCEDGILAALPPTS